MYAIPIKRDLHALMTVLQKVEFFQHRPKVRSLYGLSARSFSHLICEDPCHCYVLLLVVPTTYIYLRQIGVLELKLASHPVLYLE
jgi:hypothetical protein